MRRLAVNDKFRIKLTDRCSLACPFCHAEGGRHERDLVLGRELQDALRLLRPLYSRVHLTGGEPLLYPGMGRLLDILEAFGFRTAITTNGVFSLEECLPALTRMEYVNISVHSFRAAYVERLTGRGRSPAETAARILRNLEALRRIMPVRINTVVSGDRRLQAVEEILEFAGARGLEVKLVPEWSVRDQAERNIRALLEENGFQLFETVCLRPGSNLRERYRSPGGQIVEVKRIEYFQPGFLCRDCGARASCQEGFSFLRLGGDPLYLQPCIFREKMGLEAFREKVLPELRTLFKEVESQCGGCAADGACAASGQETGSGPARERAAEEPSSSRSGGI